MARRCILPWLVFAAAAALLGCRARMTGPATTGTASVPSSPLAGKTQLVTVVSDGWNGFRATMRRYERSSGTSKALAEGWTPVGTPVPVVLGREGCGWGRGLHGDGAPEGRPGPTKREGDGRSPAGVFGIGPAYGYDAVRDSISLPYREATTDLRCVDDPRSRHYNRIVSTERTEVDWESAEHMRRDDDLYVLTVVVEHNTESPRPRAGSCIFLHLWEGPDKGMSGCTAMARDALDVLTDWFAPGAAALVALPRVEYRAHQSSWGLPPI